MKKAFATILAVLAVTGTAFAGSDYDLKVTAPSAKKSEKAVAKINIEPKGAFHMNEKFPTKLKIEAPAGVTLEKATQTAGDAVKFEKGGASFDVAFTATESGKKSFTGVLKFAVCTDDTCKPQTENIAFDVDVK